MTIALWFCPLHGTPAHETLELIIISLQSLFPNSPVFEPHITITSDLVCNTADDVNKILTSCVAAVRSVRNHKRQSAPLISFKSCSVGKHYFRKVVLECNENPYLYSIAQVMRELYVEIDAAVRSVRNHKRQSAPLISFKSCSVGKHYFRKVVLECNENPYLYSIAQVMRELYVEIDDASRGQRAATWARDEFRPHLSLLYSEVTPISQAFLRVIQQRIEDVLNVQMVKRQGEGNTQLYWDFVQQPVLSWSLPGTFKVVRCEGPVENWRVLGRTDV
ncbi:related to 2',3'-cyclic-nucleotide 3'-phosphodiesterase [Zygosaccharomyces bailii ISA1307]|nr:related to 2',3'-cyclic-nucleotide 3'-phosphodiesterase [Zygosaccharomyces bailii ISA1307]